MNDKAKDGSDSLTILDGGRFLAAGLSVGSACQSSGNVMYVYLTAYWIGDDESNLCRSDGTKKEPEQEEQKEPLLLVEGVHNDNRRGHQQHKSLSKRHLLLLGDAPQLSVRFVLSLVFMEAIGLYGLIVALVVLGY
jgi:F0F1-type ATP synthase membrane subunit c/vacuolar-type H+-ATPase subunit K